MARNAQALRLTEVQTGTLHLHLHQFLNFPLLTLWAEIFSLWDHPVHCGMFQSIWPPPTRC